MTNLHPDKFIPPGAKRIISLPGRTALMLFALNNADDKTAVVVLKQSDKPYLLFMGKW